MSVSWIDLLQQETDEAETPRSYIYWAGLSAISAVIAPNTYINRKGVYSLTPNLYVLLIGHSGLGKGLPVFIAKKLVELVGHTRVISGQNSVQSILRDLSEVYTNEKLMDPIKDARGFVISGEFANLVLADPVAFTILTELYDVHYNEDWKKRLKHSDEVKLIKPVVTLFGGSSPEHFMEAVPKVNLFGGFLGRTLIVYEEKRYRINPLTDDSDSAPSINFGKLLLHLDKLQTIKGKFRKTGQANNFWEEWYKPFRMKEIHDPTGQVHRVPDHVLKTAMCIAASKRLELVIEEEDLREAAENVLLLGINTKRLIKGQDGESSFAKQTVAILKRIYQSDSRQQSRKQLLVWGYSNFDAYDLDRIAKTMEDAGVLDILPSGHDVQYRMTDAGLREVETWIQKEKEIN